jgi:hypothetical protein
VEHTIIYAFSKRGRKKRLKIADCILQIEQRRNGEETPGSGFVFFNLQSAICNLQFLPFDLCGECSFAVRQASGVTFPARATA